MIRLRLFTVLLVLFALVTTACGRKGAPQPPQIRRADATSDLSVLQRDDVAVLEWTYPSSTTAGGPLPDVEKIEVWRVILPRGQEPTGSSQRDRQMKIGIVEAQGSILVSLSDDGLHTATRGPRLHYEDDLLMVKAANPEIGKQVIWYLVRTLCCGDRASDFSNIARLIVELPPAPPTDVTAEGSQQGILLQWSEDFEYPVQIERSADSENWTVVTSEAVDEAQWQDTTAAQGQTWHYRLRSVADGSTGVPIIGEPGPVISVDHPDVYPPGSPADLVCLPEGLRVRLRWSSPAKGLSFTIDRRAENAEFETIAEGITTSEFTDNTPALGNLVYRVHAVDQAGNTSEATECTTLMGEAP